MLKKKMFVGLLAVAFAIPVAAQQIVDVHSHIIVPEYMEMLKRHNLELVDYVRELAERKGTTPARIALGWLLAQKPWIVPIPGTKRVERIEENIGGADVVFSPEELAEIRRKLDSITIVGARYPEDQERLTGK